MLFSKKTFLDLPSVETRIQSMHKILLHETQLDRQDCSIPYNISLSRTFTLGTL
jgi:hypothetical protein